MKNLNPLVLAAVIIGSVLAPTAWTAESLSVLLQKGIYAEETEGNLDSAIKIYLQIAAEAAANRAVVAQAQYRLAVCYQKQGKKEQAIETLQALLQQFPANTAIAQKSTDRLRELGQEPTEAVTIRRIHLQLSWVPAVSPDGRYVFHMGPDGNSDMLIADLTNGRSWVAVKADGQTYPWSAKFSPDSRELAYEFSGALFVVAAAPGAEAKKLIKGDGKAGSIKVLGWSPDNASVFAGSLEGKVATLSRIDVATGAAREVFHRNLGGASFGEPRLSGSGRYLAIGKDAKDEKQRGIQIFDLSSGREKAVVEREVTKLIGWLEGDAKVVFSSDRTGTPGLWAVPVRDGQAAGDPYMLRPNIGEITPIDFTADGNFFYTEAKSNDMAYVAAANFETGEILDEPRHVSERFPGVQSLPVWSADGSRVMLAIQRSQRRFVSVPLAAGEAAEFPLQTLLNDMPIQRIAWSPDGTQLLVQGSSAVSRAHGIHRYDLRAGSMETIVKQRDTADYDWNSHPRFAPDGKSFFYDRRKFPGRNEAVSGRFTDRIVRRDLRTGTEQVVYEPTAKLQVWWPFEVSPDGTRLAVVESDQFVSPDFTVAITVVDLSTRGRTEVLRLAVRENVSSIAWTPDGKRLVFSKQPLNPKGTPTGDSEIVSVALASPQPVHLKLALPVMRDISISPNGRQLAFRAGHSRGLNLWVVEGLQRKPLVHNEPPATR